MKNIGLLIQIHPHLLVFFTNQTCNGLQRRFAASKETIKGSAHKVGSDIGLSNGKGGFILGHKTGIPQMRLGEMTVVEFVKGLAFQSTCNASGNY